MKNTLLFLLFLLYPLNQIFNQCTARPSASYTQQYYKYASPRADFVVDDKDPPELGSKGTPPAQYFRKRNQCFSIRLHTMCTPGSDSNEKTAELFGKNMPYVNVKFQEGNLAFKVGKTVNINKPELFEIDPTKVENLRKLCVGNQYDPHCINIYIVDKIVSSGTGTESGHSSFPTDPYNVIFLRKEDASNANTVAHELGHFFGLVHTFENFGQNDNRIGDDGFDDTAMDPYPFPLSNGLKICDVNNIFNVGGINYSLPIDNLMSYYECPKVEKRFSAKQLKYMRHTALYFRKGLRKALVDMTTNIKWRLYNKDAYQTYAPLTVTNRHKVFVLVAHREVTWCDRMIEEMDNNPTIKAVMNDDFFPVIIYPEQLGRDGLNNFLGNMGFINNRDKEKMDLLDKWLSPTTVYYPAILVFDTETGRIDYFKYGYQDPKDIELILKQSLPLRKDISSVNTGN